MKYNKKARVADIVFGVLTILGAVLMSGIFFVLAVLSAAGGIVMRFLNWLLDGIITDEVFAFIERILKLIGLQVGNWGLILLFSTLFLCVWTYIGIKALVRAERAGRYNKIFTGTGDSYYPRMKLTQVAKDMGRNLAQVSADLNVMKKRGYFPNIHFDLEHKEVILSDVTYSEPLPQIGDEGLTVFELNKSIPGLAIVAAAATALAFSSLWIIALLTGVGAFFLTLLFFPRPVYFTEIRRTTPKVKKPAATGNSELDSTLNSIYENKKELVRLFDEIKSPKIKAPGKEILRILELISTYVTENPAKVKELRQFVNYYLPTTVSFIATYADLELKPEKGENINATLAKIEETAANLVAVFKREYDDLFMDKAMDIEAEVAVMKALIKEGENIL